MTTYNGWSNYQTWNVALWIDNDSGSYDYWREQAREAIEATDADEERDTRVENAIRDLAARLEHEIDDSRVEFGFPELTGCYADLLQHALGMVDWREIAKHMIEGNDDLDELLKVEEEEVET